MTPFIVKHETLLRISLRLLHYSKNALAMPIKHPLIDWLIDEVKFFIKTRASNLFGWYKKVASKHLTMVRLFTKHNRHFLFDHRLIFFIVKNINNLFTPTVNTDVSQIETWHVLRSKILFLRVHDVAVPNNLFISFSRRLQKCLYRWVGI